MLCVTTLGVTAIQHILSLRKRISYGQSHKLGER